MTTANSNYAYPLLIKQLLNTSLATAADQQIVYRDRHRHSYRAMRERVGRLASALGALGVVPGKTVAVMDWDSHRYLEAYFAVPMMAAELMMVNVRLPPEQIIYTINHANVDVLLVNSDFLPLLESIRGQLSSVRRLVLLTDDGVRVPAQCVGEYEALLAAADPAFVFADFDENATATKFYTTGTTGAPKGVYFSHRQLVLHTLSLMAALGSAPGNANFHREDVYMPMTPMFHVHAWGLPYVATVLGVKQVYPGRYQPDLLLRLIEREDVTFTHGVPTIMHMMLTHPMAKDVDISRLKAVVGGSKLPAGIANLALAMGMDIFAGYGMSETGPVLTLSQLENEQLAGNDAAQVMQRVRAGRPIPLVEIRVVDDEMRDVARDGTSTGEVVVRAPWLTAGYKGDQAASDCLWHGGYLHTNDIGRVDEHGWLDITDRLKDVIKTGGEWVSSLEVESILSGHEAVGEVAIIGVPHEKWGERPIALVVLKAGASASEEELKQWVHEEALQGRVSKLAVPDRVCFVQTLAHTSVGKLNKKMLRDDYRELLAQSGPR